MIGSYRSSALLCAGDSDCRRPLMPVRICKHSLGAAETVNSKRVPLISVATRDIHDELLARVKRHAQSTGRPLRVVVEDGLRHVLSTPLRRVTSCRICASATRRSPTRWSATPGRNCGS